jgi:hypothetical protein
MQCLVRAALAAVSAGGVLLLGSSIHAEPGDRITSNPFPLTTQERYAFDPEIAMLGDGSFVAVWKQNTQSWIRLFDADGMPRGPDVPIAEREDFDTRYPKVAIAADGSFVVAWVLWGVYPGSIFSAGRIQAQLFDPTGAPRGPTFYVSAWDRRADFRGASLAMTPDGRFVVAWSQYDPDPRHLGPWVRIYGADGTPQGNAFRTSAPPGGVDHFSRPEVAVAANGNFTVVWYQSTDNAPGVLRAKRYGPTGGPLGTAFTVANSNASGELARTMTGATVKGTQTLTRPCNASGPQTSPEPFQAPESAVGPASGVQNAARRRRPATSKHPVRSIACRLKG